MGKKPLRMKAVFCVRWAPGEWSSRGGMAWSCTGAALELELQLAVELQWSWNYSWHWSWHWSCTGAAQELQWSCQDRADSTQSPAHPHSQGKSWWEQQHPGQQHLPVTDRAKELQDPLSTSERILNLVIFYFYPFQEGQHYFLHGHCWALHKSISTCD